MIRLRLLRFSRHLLLGVGLLTSCAGCGQSSAPSAVVPNDGADMVAPQQVQAALQQLHSTRADEQLSGLKFLERFPSVAASQSEQVARLASSGASENVKKKAAALLEKLEPAVN
jgi:recombinational DNA repair protein (RecF pathway)